MESHFKEHKEYYSNRLVVHCYFDYAGNLNGEYKSWCNNGQAKLHCFYKNGKLEGDYNEWYYNGQLLAHSFYRDNKLDGEHKQWWFNGQLFMRCFYKNGKLEGEYTKWYDNNRLLEHYLYKNNQFVCRLNDSIIHAIIKLQRSFRISRALTKYFASRAFVEWWYSPTVKGGLLSKKEILSTLSEM